MQTKGGGITTEELRNAVALCSKAELELFKDLPVKEQAVILLAKNLFPGSRLVDEGTE